MLKVQIVLQEKERRHGEVRRNQEEERGGSSEEGDCGCTNRFLKEAEPPVGYFSIPSDTLTSRAEIVWESGICNYLPCGQSLFSAPKITFPRQNNGLSCEMN